jgi:Ser/Thr protein kinase RdoA (MazF antagonist)
MKEADKKVLRQQLKGFAAHNAFTDAETRAQTPAQRARAIHLLSRSTPAVPPSESISRSKGFFEMQRLFAKLR